MPQISMGKRVFGAGMAIALATALVGGAVAVAQDDKVTILSTQFEPIEEREKMNNVILADVPVETEYLTIPSTTIFFEQVDADPTIDAVGALHGEFAALAKDDKLVDLSDLAAELDVSPALLDVGKLGTDTQYYIPWQQATYIMAANVDALEYLPDGADIDALTWDQWKEWGKNIKDATGERRLGFPLKDGAGNALHHRLLQGYLYPSFTGAVNTEFATEKGLAMWDWMKDAWQYISPNATWSGMDLPLQNREVDVAWDHTARLFKALDEEPDQFVAFPAPAGPEGRGFMPVITGLGILKTADNVEGAKELIKFYLSPETQGLTLEQGTGFFPVLASTVPAEISPGLEAELAAVQAQSASEDALPALLPIGLGDQGWPYNFAFQNAITWTMVQDFDPAQITQETGYKIQAALDRSGAPCWFPDPDSGDQPCQVGGIE
jgi:multiple sugar transport system substrate-binding protein